MKIPFRLWTARAAGFAIVWDAALGETEIRAFGVADVVTR
jgi:hypothetical protein